MTKRIFRAMALTSVIALFACILFVIAVLFNYFNTQVINELESSAAYIAEGIEENGIEYLRNLEVHSKRITYVSAEGTVLFDKRLQLVVKHFLVGMRYVKVVKRFGYCL